VDEACFISDYLQPSTARLDRRFTHPLPDIPGLVEVGQFIVQAEFGDTYSVNIIRKYLSAPTGLRLVEVYKNTQNKVTGNFVRLVGTLSLVREGYPFMLLDAAIRNVNNVTGLREELNTRVAIHLPQAETPQRQVFFNHIEEIAREELIDHRTFQPDTVPPFWGPVWLGQAHGVNFGLIQSLRNTACHTYRHIIAETPERKPFDYRPLQEHNLFGMSWREHNAFQKMGLSVPVEAQAAFFSIMVSAF
jgi:hypothetical protein